MNAETKRDVLSYIRQEGFDYFFISYTDCKEFKDKELLKLRDAYIKAHDDILNYLRE